MLDFVNACALKESLALIFKDITNSLQWMVRLGGFQWFFTKILRFTIAHFLLFHHMIVDSFLSQFEWQDIQ